MCNCPKNSTKFTSEDTGHEVQGLGMRKWVDPFDGLMPRKLEKSAEKTLMPKLINNTLIIGKTDMG